MGEVRLPFSVLGLLACARALPTDLDLGPEVEWSAPRAPVDQHHATVAWVDEERPVVAFTDGSIFEEHRSWVRYLGRNGQPRRDWLLAGGARAAKPDVAVDGEGRVVVGYQGARVAVEREGEPMAQLGERLEASGNNSVDLAIDDRGRTWVVWYTQLRAVGRYHAAALDPELRELDRLPGILAEVDNIASSTPDIDVTPDGDLLLTWVDQRIDQPTPLILQRWSPRGRLRWQIEVDIEQDGLQPRRGTVASLPDGRIAIGWRKRGREPRPTSIHLAVLDPDGGPLLGPLELVEGDSDDLVLAPVGDDGLWLTWTRVLDDEGLGTILGGLWSIADEGWAAGPAALSSSDLASRPHTAAIDAKRGARAIVSWEAAGDDGVRRVYGRVLDLR